MKVRNEASQTFNIHCQVHLHPHKLFLETSAGTEQVSLFRPSFCLKFKGQLLLFGNRQEEYIFQNMCYKHPLHSSTIPTAGVTDLFHFLSFLSDPCKNGSFVLKEKKEAYEYYCLLRYYSVLRCKMT